MTQIIYRTGSNSTILKLYYSRNLSRDNCTRIGYIKDIVLQIINKEVLKNDENSNGPSFTLKARSERLPLNNLDHGDLIDLEQKDVSQ